MKAILILDMPSNCYECQLQDSEWDICHGLDKKLYEWEGGFPSNYVCDNCGEEKPTWCPLKPTPKRLLILSHYQGNELLNSEEVAYAKGRNNCLDEILGETE